MREVAGVLSANREGVAHGLDGLPVAVEADPAEGGFSGGSITAEADGEKAIWADKSLAGMSPIAYAPPHTQRFQVKMSKPVRPRSGMRAMGSAAMPPTARS